MPYTYTVDIFDWLIGILKGAFTVADPSALPLDGGGNHIWPVDHMYVDDVIWYSDGNPATAVERSVPKLRDGNYGAAILLGFTTQQQGMQDAAGLEFSNLVPITILVVRALEGREDLEADARALAQLHDEVYLELKPYNHPPADIGLKHFLWANSFAIAGTPDWHALRMGYVADRLADDEP